MRRLALLVFLAVACTTENTTVRKDVSTECRTTSDCPSGGTCNRGVCEDVNPYLRCLDDNECPTGQFCMSGYCEAARPDPNAPPAPGR